MATVLAVDDDPESLDAVRFALGRAGHVVIGCSQADHALAELGRSEPDVLLVDRIMPTMGGLELCEHALRVRPDVPVILMTALGDVDAAVAAIRAGAFDFLVKPIPLASLLVAVDRAARHHALLDQIKILSHANEPAHDDGVIGRSPPLRQMLDVVLRVADTDASVLVTGPSGSGKEAIARLLHRNGRRRVGPFVSINCAAMPASLLESELFGHAKGAFTDAREARPGLFVQARGGTFFLDEIGDMPIALQPKLLRALQERCVRPVGSTREIPIDVRIVAATNQDLETLVEEKRFRADLYFRLNVVQVMVPPLRTRGVDILLLAKHFLERFARDAGRPIRSFSRTAAERLLAYDWPGNVRELQNCVERAVALARFDTIGVEDLPDRIRQSAPASVALVDDDPSALVTLRQIEIRYISRVMSMVAGNKTTAARVLGIDRTTLYRKLEEIARDTGGKP